MDTDPLKDRSAEGRVVAFLKTELFYLIVLLAVVAVGASRTYQAYKHPDMVGPAMGTVDQKVLFDSHFQQNARQMRDNPKQWAVYNLARLLDLGCFVGGVAVLLALAFRRIFREEPESDSPPMLAVYNPPWGLWDVLKLGSLFAAGAMVFQAIFTTDPLRPFVAPNDWMAEIFARVLVIGALLHIAIIERGARLADIGIRRGIGHPLLLGILAFLVIQPFMAVIVEAQKRWFEHIPLQSPLQGMLETHSPATLTLAVIVAVFLGPISEEMLFRGFLQPVLQKWLGGMMGILMTAAFFAVAHMDLYVMPQLFLLGLALGYIYDRSRSLTAPVVSHILFNALSTFMLFGIRVLYSR